MFTTKGTKNTEHELVFFVNFAFFVVDVVRIRTSIRTAESEALLPSEAP